MSHYDRKNTNNSLKQEGYEKYRAFSKDLAEDEKSEKEENKRERSRQRAETSYQDIMHAYSKLQDQSSQRPAWIDTKTKGALEPDELTVTHVNQTSNLLSYKNKSMTFGEKQTSKEWLEVHSIEKLHLQLKDLVDKGKIAKPIAPKAGEQVQQHIEFDSTDINEFEYQLNLAVESYTNRIKWLLMGSRRMFGLIKGVDIAVLIDSSAKNFAFGRLSGLQESLTHLLDEQLSEKNSIYLVSFGTDLCPLWTEPRKPNERTLGEAKAWVDRLVPAGGCNLLKALKSIYRIKEIDTIVVIQGSIPDQKSEHLSAYVEEMSGGRDVKLHTVAYDTNNYELQTILSSLAELSDGRYSCFSSSSEEQIYLGDDVSLLLKETQEAQNVLNKIRDMRRGLLGTALVSVLNEISNEVAKLPQSKLMPRPPGHELPLKIEIPKFLAASSVEWLLKQGLKAKKMDLYQVLAPHSYAFKEEFIPVIGKTVQSQVHEKAMTQFQWHDGTVKNVHVDLSSLFEYQKQLGGAVKIFEQRIDWLSSQSRKYFGTICEKNIIIMVDLSVSNINYITHIQHSLRLLLQEQMANKNYFNIIGFGSNAKAWRSTMVIPTEQSIEKAWRWILDLECGGSRNFMDAFRMAVENDEEQKHGIKPGGVYLFTSGIPDQMQDVCCQYIEEASTGQYMKLHIVLFNVDDYDAHGAIPSRYANITKTAETLRNMAHCSGGRFHWFRETGIIESDDIALVNLEISKALNYSKKCLTLVDAIKNKYNTYENNREKSYDYTPDLLKSLPPGVTHRALPSSTRHPEIRDVSEETYQKDDLMNKPSINSRHKIEATIKARPQSAKNPLQKAKREQSNVQKAFFFTDSKHGIGAIYDKYPAKKGLKSLKSKPIKAVSIPESEEQLSTKQWLRMYSLVKLKLDFNKVVSGTECKHSTKPVKVLQKAVESKICSILPSVCINGVVKHVQIRPFELQEYELQVECVLRRYLKRLQWLLTNSRKLFGTIVEKSCVILIDTSGSMDSYMTDFQKDLIAIIWDQLHKNYIRFNLIQFSRDCNKLFDDIQEPTKENCHAASKWISELDANGNTCTLEALQMAFSHSNIESIYLLTDGKPDTSTSMVHKEVTNMNSNREIAINTISFNCDDSTANDFLKLLAKDNNGRYHKCQWDFDAHLFAHKLLSEGFTDPEHPHMPEFEGDDLKHLGTEINKSRKFLYQSRILRSQLEIFQKNLKDPLHSHSDAKSVGPSK